MASENLGEFLTGNKIQSSPYKIHMLKESYCNILCQVTLNKSEAKVLASHIKYGYHNNWIIDNLPSASINLSYETGERKTHYAGGFPVGFVMSKPGRESDVKELHLDEKKKYTPSNEFFELEDAYLFNHVNIVIKFHPISMVTATASGENSVGYRVVGFAVEALSIKHTFLKDYPEGTTSTSTPLKTCPPQARHMELQYIQKPQIVAENEDIVYTYDVIFLKSSIAWASRWDLYLTEDHMVPAQVHWYSITNSILVVLFLSIVLVSILVRNLRKDIGRYNNTAAGVPVVTMTDEEREEEYEESGWKQIHGDVFRPPTTHSMTLAVLVGSGVQLTMTSMASILFSALGFLNPSRRGSLMTGVLVFFILCGSFAGYVSSRLYKAFRGSRWQTCTIVTAIGYPGLCFTMFLFFNIILFFKHSSGSVPFRDIVILAAMWCCVSIPLVFIGSYVGYQQESIHYPTVTATIAKAIPPPSNFLTSPLFPMIFAGAVPFAAAYVELFFMMTSLWMDQFYYIFGFTLIVFVILLITCSEITILLCYYQLCAENHRWWWFSFITAGSVGFYLFGYSVVWYHQLEPSKLFVTHLLYFGYMFLISVGTFLITGSTGLLSCLWFTRKIFSTIKVD
jgi:transmembrane 9 superfamily protein 2/4